MAEPLQQNLDNPGPRQYDKTPAQKGCVWMIDMISESAARNLRPELKELKEFFTSINFSVTVTYANTLPGLDTTAGAIKSLLTRNSRNELYCFLCVVMGSDGIEEHIYLKDDRMVSIKTIVDKCTGDVAFLGKPILFLIQACTEGTDGRNIDVNVHDDGFNVPKVNDRCIAYAQSDEFLNSLVEVLKRFKTEHFEKILLTLKETTNIRYRSASTLTKPLYLKDDSGVYGQQPGQRGFVLIANMMDNCPVGLENLKSLRNLFAKDKIYCQVMSDTRVEEAKLRSMFQKYNDILSKSVGNPYYFFLCIIMSHGDSRGVCDPNITHIPIDDITAIFSGNHGSILRPKIFVAQACPVNHDNLNNDHIGAENLRIGRVPVEDHTLIAYAKSDGFITALIREIQTSHETVDFEEIVNRIRRNLMNGGNQDEIPNVWSSLKKKLYINAEYTYKENS